MKTSTTPASSLEANEVWKLAKKNPKTGYLQKRIELVEKKEQQQQ